jgi:glucose/arabinose dehydrogenase
MDSAMSRRRVVRAIIAVMVAGLSMVGIAAGVIWFVNRPSIVLEPFAIGFAQPVAMIEVDGRFLVAERSGLVREVGREAPILDLRSKIEDGYEEQGLLGLVFHNGKLFVDYTRAEDGATVVEAYSLRGGVDAQPILLVPQPAALHNGGQLAFGPDGYLYIGLGDGGDVGKSFARGQSTDDLLGAILRIDVSETKGYEIPPDNPFVGQAGSRPELWAIGLRNPWRFSFDRETGDLYIADVGYYEREEIDVQLVAKGGMNFGWAEYEGTRCQHQNPSVCRPQGLTMPAVEYVHGLDQCAVIGGFVYRGIAYPTLKGRYVYGDYCSGQIWSVDLEDGDAPRQMIDSQMLISAFAEDERGELYVLSYGDGTIYRLVPT